MTITEMTTTAKAPHGVNGGSSAFNDWPNDAGFEIFHDEKEPVELKVSGRIPAYAAGRLYRTGPGGHQITTSKNEIYSVSHWFDGFAQTHRFELLPPTDGKYITSVKYNSRHTCNTMIEKIREAGRFNKISFGQQQDPCESFFRKVMSSFQAATGRFSNDLEDYNVGVTVQANLPMTGSPSNKDVKQRSTEEGSPSQTENVWLKSDHTTLQSIDPTTLAPVEISSNAKLHPSLKGPFTGAHSRTDPITGDWYNYNLELGRQAVYRVFRVSAQTGEATILATLSGGDIRPAYLHSILLTESYVIICIFNAYYAKGGMKVLWTRNMLDALDSDPNQKNIWLVVDRLHGKGLVGIFESDPFFAFHPVNAWEQHSATETGKVDIIADIPTYENMDVLKRFYYHNIKGTSPSALDYAGEKGSTSRPSLHRFRLPSVGATTIAATSPKTPVETIFTAPKADTPELPTFNPTHATKPSRYIYGVSDRGYSTFVDGLLKYDTHTQTAVSRIVHGHSPGEPIFLPDPKGVDEDDGVLLSVVLDGTKGKSYLLCLDAKGFEEVGRAEMEGVVAFGFHGSHVC